ncbi:MAG: gliding motility-associated C-terminal domain-containing protein [Bacteroidales bacterium]|nr:gliding motility-associated C-terminal domain-containing protein [Bacteroidales bacterium]
MKRLLTVLLFFLGSCAAFATHQRAGEITYEHVSGLTYRFTILTYTYTPSAADRPELEILWGDGTSSVVPRNSKVNMANDISRNIYIAEHTFPTTGTYAVSLEDPNRNDGIINIPNSVNIPFYLETVLIINPFLGANSSPQLLNPPIDDGCLHHLYYHNPGAYDADGDSLSYSLVTCRGYDGEDIPGYALPQASSYIRIDPQTGDLIWDSPVMQGEYNIAIMIKEWRHGVLIGSVIRDMQITIIPCNNEPPTIHTIEDTCITAGDTLRFDVTATDPNSTSVALTATSGIFQLAQHHATFTTAQGPPPVTGHFWWETSCEHVQLSPYSILFKAADNGPQVNLSAYKTVLVTVVAPPPENLVALPVGNTIQLSWDSHTCTNVAGYAIYRRNGSYEFEPDLCETGLPGYTGYRLIGYCNNWQDCHFTDDGSGLPLYHGTEYCYRVVAFFDDGSESYVSDEACTLLHNDVPRITHVDIDETDSENGIILLKWLKASELDTIQYPGPHYEYHLYRGTSPNPYENALIHTSNSLDDTTFTDIQLNTQDLTYYYQVELWAQVNDSMVLAGTSDMASSVRLSITPADRALQLQWNEQVPWTNVKYVIYRQNADLHTFDSIAVVGKDTLSYLDQNLQNGQNYCYYVKACGSYFAPDTIAPFHNRSQRNCAVPADLTPPEVPALTVTTDCQSVDLSWSFSSDSAYLDIHQYYIYYKPTYDDDYVIIDSFYYDESCYPASCHRQLSDLPFVVGCFTIAAIDTAGNLSARAAETCFDGENCASYQLPNIITPNGDGYNDELIPFPYENVAGVEFYLYNRWGRLVFKTTDTDIHWDGKDMYSHRESSDGTYYYVCKVKYHTLTGLATRDLNGTITVIR